MNSVLCGRGISRVELEIFPRGEETAAHFGAGIGTGEEEVEKFQDLDNNRTKKHK